MLTIHQLIKLIHHSNPEASVVELVSGAGNAQPLLPTLAITDALKTASYTIYVPDEPTKQVMETHLQPLADVGVEVRDMSRTLANGEEESHLDTFNLVIIPAPDAPREAAVLENVMKLLASDGRLFVVAPVEQAHDIEAFGRAAGVQDWFRLELDHPDQRLTMLLGHRRRETAVNGVGHSPEVIILQSPDPSAVAADLAGSLMAQLTSKGYPTSSRTWGACEAPDYENKACISLVEIDRPILQHLHENDFNFVQGLILGAEKVLWIGAPPETASGSAVVTGLARVVRSEEPGIVFHTLNLSLPSKGEEMSVELEKICGLVLRTFQDSGGENEFRINNGVIEVSRLVEDDELNAELLEGLGLGRQKTTTVKQVPLEDAGRPLKLCVRNAGLLDSLCFEPDTLPDTALADDEVEIEVKATSLKYDPPPFPLGPDRRPKRSKDPPKTNTTVASATS
jgi:zearalenone synthase (highly reducing iterative type I polyketide synthase)